jgi:ribonuclease E
VRVLRDYFTNDVAEVWVDDAEGFQEALRYFKSTLPRFQKRLKLYVGDKSLFSAYRIEEQIEALDSAKVPLRSGGSVVIEATEAMVSIDVNSGRSNQSSDIEETALNTNMEAATEVARQLRLRNLGGLIVIDFIDMMAAKNRKQVEKTLADALKGDKARTTLGTISQFGLLELSRQRIDMELSRGVRYQCPSCGGTGHVPTVNSSANNVLRKVRELAASGKYTEIHGELPIDAANFLLNSKREALRDLEQEFEVHLHLEADPTLPAGHRITLHGSRGAGAEGEEEVVAAEAPRGERPLPAEGESEERSSRRRRRRRGRGRGGREEDVFHPTEPGAEPEGDYIAVDNREEEEEPWEMEDTREIAEPFEDEEEAPGALAAPVEEPPPARQRGRRPGRREGREDRPRREGREDRPRRGDRGGRPRDGERAAAGNGGGNRVEFSSVHIVTDPEALAKLPPPFVRSRPFAAVMGDVRPNQVVFDSSLLWQQPAGEAPVPAAPKEGGSRRKRGGRKSTGARQPSAGSGAAPAASGDQAAGQEPAVSASPAGKQAAAPTRNRRPPRGRGRGRGQPPAAALPQDEYGEVVGNLKPPPAPEPPEVNGNVKEPAPRPPARKARGRGRSRGGRPSAASAAGPSA